MQPGTTIAQLNRLSTTGGKKTLTRSLALVIGVSALVEGQEQPDLNLVAFNPAKAAALGGPDWQLAFDRLNGVKHSDHADVTSGKETVFYSDSLELYSVEDVRLHEDVLAGTNAGPAPAQNVAQQVSEAVPVGESPSTTSETSTPSVVAESSSSATSPETPEPTSTPEPSPDSSETAPSTTNEVESSTPSPEPSNEQSETAVAGN